MLTFIESSINVFLSPGLQLIIFRLYQEFTFTERRKRFFALFSEHRKISEFEDDDVNHFNENHFSRPQNQIFYNISSLREIKMVYQDM